MENIDLADKITEWYCDKHNIEFLTTRHLDEEYTEEAQDIYNEIFDLLENLKK